MLVTALALLGVLAVLFGAAVLATREGGELAEAPPDTADLALPPRPLSAADVELVRLPMAVRGYRMAEVDAVLERLALELTERDRRLAALEGDGRPDVAAAEAQGHPTGGPSAPPRH